MIPIAKPLIGKEEEEAVLEVLRTGMLTQGTFVAELEERFASFSDAKNAVATVNGTIALHLALKACGIGKGEEVITTPFTFMATASSILGAGGKPILVDIDPRTFNIDPVKVEAAITEKTKAIMPVHLYGLAADMDPLKEIAKKHDLQIIEDACQAHGASYKGRKVGALGDAGAFSFYPTKNMTTGEGGIVTTDSDELAEKMRMLRNHGQTATYQHTSLGFNYRMTNICGAIGVEQMKKLEHFTKRRKENGAYLNKHLADVEGIEIPHVPEGCVHVYHQYTLQSDRREEIMQKLEAGGVSTRIYYPKGVHQYDHLAYLKTHDLSMADRAARRVFSLPIHPSVTQENLELMVDIISKA